MSRAAPRLRRLWFRVHQWIGIGLLIGLIPLGLTGSLLVWRQSLDRMQHPGRYGAAAPAEAGLAPSRYLAAARDALDDRARPTMLRMPRRPGDPVVVSARPARTEGGQGGGEGRRAPQLSVWLDPATARVLEVGSPQDSTVAWLHRLHETFLSREVGGQVVGWLGWAMLASSLTGLWLWWPRGGDVLKGLRFRRTGDTFLNLHHMAGFWISLPLAILSATGVYLAFPQTGRAVVSAFAPMSPPEARGPGGGPGAEGRRERSGGEGRTTAPSLDVDAAVAKALASTPGSRLASVALPGRRAPVWRVQVRAGPGDPVGVTVAGSGAVTRAPAPLPGDAVNQWMHRLHGGQQTSPVWQWVITLAGAAPLLLGVTGLVVWLRRRTRRAGVATI